MTSLVSLILQPSITQWSQRSGALEDLLGIYGSAMDQTRAKQWLRAFAEADFSGLPPVITLSAERMPGLWGGYSREKNRIYISSDCPPEHLAAVLLEEVGHFLDRELCVCETTGEEGARFAAVVLGQQPSAEQLASWAEDDGLAWVEDQGGPVLVEGAKKKSGGGGKKNSGGSDSDGGGKKKKSNNSKSGGSSEKRKKSRSSPPADSGGGGSSSGGAAPVASQPPKPSDFQNDPVQSYPGETLTGSSGSTFVVSDPANVTIGGNLTGTETIETDADGLNLGNFNQIENAILTGVANISASGNSLRNVIRGNAGNNYLSGGEGNDTLVGLAGNDSLDGGTGNDSMVGGTGNDTFIVDAAGDVVVEVVNEGTDVVKTSVDYVLAEHVEALELSGVADIDGTGNSLGNTITGNSGSNFLDGLGGDDTISGAGGNDTMLGGAGNDSLDGGTGNDSLIGGAGDDTFVVDSDTDSIVENANEGTDVVQSSLSYSLGDNLENLVLTGSAISGTGNSLSNSLTGNSVGNSLDGGTGIDTMIGAQGNDTYFVDHTSDVVTEISGEGTDLVVASESYALANHVEHLVLTGTAIAGTGNSLNNSITGNSIGNSLEGGSGVDTLIGGSGNDTYIVDTASDRIVEDGGDAVDLVVSSVSFNLSNALVGGGNTVENLQLTGTAVSGTGNALNNLLTGNSGNNLLTGNGGNDTFIGGEGNDTFIGDTGADSMVGDTGADSMVGGGGADTFVGGAGNDTIVVNSATSVTVDGGADNDTLKFVSTSGMTLGDSDFGGYSNIESYDFTGVTGNVDITIGLNAQNLGIATLAGGTANSTLTANSSYSGSVHFTGGALADSLTGNSGNDTLAGAGENDTIVGGSGADSLDGGTGNDSMVGGTGNDTYVVDSALDVIVENASEGTDVVRSSVSYTLGSNIESLELTGTSDINGTGDALANTITGNSGNNVLAGEGGNDTLIGGAGNDSLDGGSGNDSMVGGAGNDTFVVDSATDVVVEATGEGTDEVRASINFTLGSNLERLVLTGTAVSGTGNILANTVTGNASANSLDGGAGIDSLIGGAGDDTYFVDNASEVVVEASGEGTDLVISSVSGYTLANHVENLELAASAVAGTGNSLNNMITGNSVGNSLDGGSGVDTLIGGSGNDTYFIDTTAEMIVETGSDSADVVVASVFFDLSSTLAGGGNSIENLQLTGTAVSGTGNALNNTLTGNSVGNSLNGGAGIDMMIGGQGNDTYFVDNATEVVTELSGEGTDLVVASVTGYTLASNVEQLQLAGAVVVGTGNSLANTLTGNATGNSLDGGEGIDSLIGGAGNDTYVVDNASDVVFENADEGDDLVESSVNYTLSANVEKLTLTGTAIAATGNSLANTLTGNASANSLDGGSGIDSMVGGAGNDTYFVDNVGDVVFENASEGTDVVVTTVDGYTMASEIENLVIGGTGNLAGSGSAGNNLLTGNSGNNLLTGNGGNDTFIGGEGNDTLVGDTGADSMVGGVGADSMVGGGGADTFVGGAGNDTIVVNSATSVTVDGGADNDTLKFVSTSGMTLGDAFFGGFSNIESYDFTSVTGNVDITIGLNAQNLGIATLAGGTANSTLTANSSYSGSVHFTGGALADSLTGNSGNDTLLGLGGNDTFVGNAGNDSIDGGTGDDSMVGGLGNDTYVVDSALDVIVENASEGTDVVRSSVSYTLGSNIESLELTGTSDINGTGDALANTITGNSGNNVLAGAGGNDTLIGGAGNDSLDGGSGNDSMVGGAGNDTYVVDSATDVVVEAAGEGTDLVQTGISYTLGSNFENLELTGTSNINGTGNDLDNSITGNSGNNTLAGGDGNDTISGGGGDDSLYGGAGGDSLVGGSGNDTLVADATGSASLLGGDDNDSFLFSSGTQIANNTVVGGSGTDTLVLTATSTVTDGQLANVSGVEVIQASSLAGNSITVGANAIAGGVLSLFGGASSDFLSAAGMVSGNIWIQGDAIGGTSTLGDTLTAGVGTSRATLVGRDHADAENYFRISTASLLGNNSIVGGSNSDDYLQITGSNQTLTDASFAQVSDLNGLILSGGSNNITLGVTAQAKFGATISLTGGANGGDTINLSATTKKVYLDASAGSTGDTITAGSDDNTLIGGSAASANDLFIFTSGSHLNGASVVGGGGTDTLRLSANGQTVVSTDLDKLSSIEVFDLAGAGNNITLGAISAGIATIVGGTGPNTFNAAGYNSAPNALTWNMNASNGSDSLLGGANGNLFQIRNGANLQNSFITGNTGSDTIQLLAGAQTLGDSTFSNISGNSIEQLVLGSATNGNSITLGTTAASKGIDTVIGGTRRDTIDATAFNSAITIDASASSGSRLIGSTANTNQNTLIGGSAGGNEFVLGSISTNSLVGGSNGLDTLTLTQGGAVLDSAFTPISKIGTLKLEGSANTFTLGANALIAGIRTLVGGEGNDNGAGNSINTSAYGSAGVLFQVTDQDYLANITTLVGGTGVDTLKFSRDGVSITDENVAKLFNIDVLRTANGNNRFLYDDAFVAAGIETIIGGTGRDTIDMASDTLYIPADDDDIITVDLSAGSGGYTLISNTQNFEFAKVIGSTTNTGSVIIDGAILEDDDFRNMYQGNIRSLFMRVGSDNTVTLDENARASGLDTLTMSSGNDTIDASGFTGTLAINGGDGDDIVRTSFAALSNLTYTGGGGVDTLRLTGAEARSITSLAGNFEALALNAGNNFVILGNDASLTAIVGGTGIDTISMLQNTTGINFVMDADMLGNTAGFASLDGGSGMDTLTVRSVGTTFVDNQFARVGSVNWADDIGAIENFVTEAGAGDTYTFGRMAYDAGIINVHARINGQTFIASAFNDGNSATKNDRGLNFVFDEAVNAASAGITGATTVTGGTGGNDTLTLTTDAQTLGDTAFANKFSLETLVLGNGANNITLNTNARTAHLARVVSGSGNDTLTFNTDEQTVLIFNGGAQTTFDSAIISNAGADFGDDYFDDWTSVERLTTADGANNITLGANAVTAGIATVTGGTGDDTFNASAYTNALWIDGAAGNNSVLGGSSANTLVGGTGNDNFTGGASNDSITSGGGADTFNGGAGNDTIVAGSGDDSITGGEGVDSLLGGAGNDTFEYTGLGALASDASVDGGANDDRIKFTGVVSYILTGEIDSAFAKVSGFEIVELATGVSNRFNLTTVVATAGIGTIVGGSGNDTIDAATALSAVSLSGAGGRDSIIGGFGSDNLLGGDGDDTIVGAQDDALLDGGADTTDDWLQVGSNFNDTGDGQIVNIEKVEVTATGLTVNLGDQTEGFNVIGFATGATTLLGGSGADTFTGGSGADWLQGTSALTAGANQIDTLTGDVGNDTFVLGDAVNAYYNTAVNGGDFAVITDFAAGDKLQLKTLDGAAAGNGYLIGNQIYGAVGSSNYYLYRDSNNNNAIEADDNLIAAINSSVALTTVNLKSTHGLFV